MKTRIYGVSDDLIEIDGYISDEVDAYLSNNEKLAFSVSDGTKGDIKYDNDGCWRINVVKVGTKFLGVTFAIGDENKHTGDAEGCNSYSDVLFLDEGIEWVRIGRKKYKK